MNSMILRQSERLADAIRGKNKTIVTAESCTAGGIAYAITSIPESSLWFHGGMITYHNHLKSSWLHIDKDIIEHEGAVSEAVVSQMVQSAVKRSGCDYGVAVSGIAGPGGGSPEKPVGSVWFAWAGKDFPLITKLHHFDGNRAEIREQSILAALQGLVEWAIQL